MPRGGLFLWCELPDGVDATGVAVAAEDEGLLVAAGPALRGVGGLDRWVRLPYVLAPEVMTEAVERLARAVERVRAGGAAGRRHARAHGPAAGGLTRLRARTWVRPSAGRRSSPTFGAVAR